VAGGHHHREKKPWWGYGFAQGVIFWRGKWWVCPRTYYAKDGATALPVVLFAEDGEQFHAHPFSVKRSRVHQTRAGTRSVDRWRRQ
jgi:hypothetical protein